MTCLPLLSSNLSPFNTPICFPCRICDVINNASVMSFLYLAPFRAVSKDSPHELAGQHGSVTDELDYSSYAQCLAKLFRNNKDDILPAAVGIYAPWGSGKVRLQYLQSAALIRTAIVVVCCSSKRSDLYSAPSESAGLSTTLVRIVIITD